MREKEMTLITASMKEGDLHPLRIDYQLYTDGDPGFKRKLLSLMIDNLQELLDASRNANNQAFQRAIHKAKPTLLILEDSDFNQSINRCSEVILNKTNDAESIQHYNNFKFFCERIINSLHREIEMM